MRLEYIIVLLLIGIFLIVIMYIEPILAKHKVKNSNEYGSARFSSFKEIKNNFEKEKIKKINEVGFPIYFSKKLDYGWFDVETPHWVYLGSTGSGKSVTQVIPYCAFLSSAKQKRSAFITDPKGEIFNTTSKMFKDRGYEVLTIDFRNPENSNKFNILEPIILEYEKYIKYNRMSTENSNNSLKLKYNNLAMSCYAETNRLITSLSKMIMKDKVEAKDPFWLESAKNLLEGLIGFFLEEYSLGNIKREQITMTSIRKFQNSSMDSKNFIKFKNYLNKKEYGNKSKDSLTSIITASDNTYKSITSVFGSKMAIFDDVNVANVTSISNIKLDEIGKKPTVLYVIVPDEDKTYFTLVTIIVGLLYKELVKVANNEKTKKLPVQIDWILDEFANCPPLDDIEAIVSVARSRGMRFHFFIQSFAQLDNVYGKDVAQIILDNCGLIYLKTNTQDTAEAISKRLGKKTIEQSSISQSMSLTRYDGNQSTSLMARDLLTPDEIKQLHYKMIIFPTRGYPIFRDTYLYNKFSVYQSGCIKRKVNPLVDLSNTYYTVENIQVKKLSTEEEKKEFLDDYNKIQENRFEYAKNRIDNLFENLEYSYKYIHKDNNIYLVVNTMFEVKKYQFILKKELRDYHLQFNKNNKSVFEVHLKGLKEIEV